MTRSRLFVIAVIGGGASLVAACSGSATAAPHASSAVPVASTVAERQLDLNGTYVQPPVNITGIKTTGAATSPFQATGGTMWHGDLEGQTSFTIKGIVNLQTGASHGTNDETFTGSVRGLGSGHLHLQETFTVSAQAVLSLDATIVSSDGALSGLRGRMHFEGPSDLQTGAGSGTYTASFVSSR
jgi:hypothetical protein